MSRLFLGGLPTEPDVARIRDALGELEIGREIAHEQIEALIRCDRKSSRYRGVTAAWRRCELKQNNIEIAAVAGVGYKVLNASERLSHNYERFQEGTRKQARSVRRVSLIRDADLSKHERTKRDHVQRMGAVIVSQAADLAKLIEPPKPRAPSARIAPK